MIDPNNRWLFYQEHGRRGLRGRWYILIFAILYFAGWAIFLREAWK
jgi:hypothetical protein